MKGEYERFICPGARGSGWAGSSTSGCRFLTTAAWPWRDLGQRAQDVRQQLGGGSPEQGLELGRQGYDRVSVEEQTYLFVGGERESEKGRRARELEVWIIGVWSSGRFAAARVVLCVTRPDTPFAASNRSDTVSYRAGTSHSVRFAYVRVRFRIVLSPATSPEPSYSSYQGAVRVLFWPVTDRQSVLLHKLCRCFFLQLCCSL